jgi:hypothetical protein
MTDNERLQGLAAYLHLPLGRLLARLRERARLVAVASFPRFPDPITEDMTPEEALAFTITFLDTEPDDDALCLAALTIGEPLIDWHWMAIEEAFVALLSERQSLRKIVSCCDFDQSVPEHVRARIYAFVGPEDDIGSQPASDP